MTEEAPTQPAPAQLPPGPGDAAEARARPEAAQGPPQTPTEGKKGRSATEYFIIAIGVMIGVVFLVTIIGVIVALADPDASGKIGAVRDIFIIVLAWFSILIGLALVILVLQVAALVNLLKNEVIPILESLQQTANTVRGTAQFMGQNLARPVVRAQGFFAAVRRVLEILRLMSPDYEPEGFEPDGEWKR